MGIVFNAGNDVFGVVMRAGCARDVFRPAAAAGGVSFTGLTWSRDVFLVFTSGVLLCDETGACAASGVAGSLRGRAVGVWSLAAAFVDVLRGAACGDSRFASMSAARLLSMMSQDAGFVAARSFVFSFGNDVALVTELDDDVSSCDASARSGVSDGSVEAFGVWASLAVVV